MHCYPIKSSQTGLKKISFMHCILKYRGIFKGSVNTADKKMTGAANTKGLYTSYTSPVIF